LLVITLAFYLSIIVLATRHYQFNLSALLGVGDRTVATVRAQLLGHHVVVFQHSNGFDGQLYYYVADDPLPMLRPTPFTNAFYYQRVLYPLLTAVVSLGHRDIRPLVMVLINLIFVEACAWLAWLLAADFAATNGTISRSTMVRGSSERAAWRVDPSWWILLAAITPSLILAVQLDLPEPMAYTLALGGFLAWRRGRMGLCALCFSLALLTRESTLMLILPTIAVTILRRRWVDALLLGSAAVPYLVWKAVLSHTFAHSDVTVETWEGIFQFPFDGIRGTLLAAAHALAQHHIGSLVIHPGSVLVVIAIVMAAGVLAIWQLRCGGDAVVGGTFLAATAVGIFGSGAIWDAFANAGRDFGLVFPMFVFSLATRHHYRRLALGLCVLSALLTVSMVYRELAISPTLPYTVTR
jgi:hypothetical protein